MKSSAALVLLAFFCGQARAEIPFRQAPLPSQTTSIDDVVVPVPSEIFGSLDRFANSNWSRVLRPDIAAWKPRGGQAQVALRLGVVIAEGFVAVAARDEVEVKTIGRSVIALARALGIEDAALKRSRSIVEHAEEGDWSAVREEWNLVLPDVQGGMKDLRSQEMAQVVSLGGWLRGTEALTALLSQNYSPREAELLRQPALLTELDRQLSRMNPEIQMRPTVPRMREAIQKTTVLLESGAESTISPAELKELAGICQELLKSVTLRR